ncbi:MAG: mechanosensitive ion channel family protein [Chloroflexota bacterium]|nr:mechanosensitive ion channel family protein [Chloroflexota bacterium]MQF84386.1 mechanosensitive ion channel family protein [SAR202 cluster bacterium]MED5254960.1 mechanosensitive ion channel family protein [Chloroflexota bacterium]MQG20273.1 mechanosensitive ion channel family protein [SAR202 cluster bacterium]MQG23443.1 mechanosensitive ion channel family protein [SAR202 cluster bacterium]|tara:strand:- start:3302 stop:4636 length:1335 start_codon:yes stop_codon:yes gene_type:complete
MENFLNSVLNFLGYDSLGKWFLSEGIWAILLILSVLTAWFIFHRFTRPKISSLANKLKNRDETRDVGTFVSLLDTKAFDSTVLIILLSIMSVGLLSIVGINVSPVSSYFQQKSLDIFSWLFSQGLVILIMILTIWGIVRLIDRIFPRLVTTFVMSRSEYGEHEESEKRATTLSRVFTGGAQIIVILAGVFMILSKLSIPVGPVLAGFGVVGIAVGFGAQHLVRDLISGIFVIAENQYRTGDVVTIAGTSGLVEDINLRRTILRDLEGTVHVVPNGEISVSANRTKNYSRVVLDVGVAYKENLERVIIILNQIGNELSADPVFGLNIIKAPQVLRIQSFDDSCITIRMLGDCKPMKQWNLRSELIRRIKARFDIEGIEIPFPHQTIYWGEDQPTLTIQEKTGNKKSKKSVKEDRDNLTPEKIELILAEYALAKRGSLWNDQDLDE